MPPRWSYRQPGLCTTMQRKLGARLRPCLPSGPSDTMGVTNMAGCVSSLLAGVFRLFCLEPVVFTVLVLLHLAPIWSFPYLPTQDGPSHLANAMMLKDYYVPGTRYHELFGPRWETFPNWTSHLLLIGLLYIVPPLAAEK